MRRIGLVFLAGIVAVGVAVPSSAREGATLAAYRARGNLDFISTNPGPPDLVRGAAQLSKPIRGAGEVPLSASMSLSGRVVRGTTVAANPCLEQIATGTLTIFWSDGSSSSGAFTMARVSRTLTILATLNAGRLKGVVTVAATMPPGPPKCDASFSGQAGVAIPPGI